MRKKSGRRTVPPHYEKERKKKEEELLTPHRLPLLFLHPSQMQPASFLPPPPLPPHAPGTKRGGMKERKSPDGFVMFFVVFPGKTLNFLQNRLLHFSSSSLLHLVVFRPPSSKGARLNQIVLSNPSSFFTVFCLLSGFVGRRKDGPVTYTKSTPHNAAATDEGGFPRFAGDRKCSNSQ